ncbi:GNAT family N-acetyltransferase [Dyella choica]|uniref:GNAT family N-acetyltransferase n=1 Tax=Dyella choica TaxID=1927959 RepID=A0A432M066_9GAMM|nr:GNAT family N-acetyltransferase [Dyella choica]RUL69699.1 GNAT family N-acetyltransferase [Dyella choica]
MFVPGKALRIRLGQPGDASAIGVLSRRVVRRWVLPDQSRKIGRELLLRLAARALRQKIIDGQRFHLAYLGDKLVGVAAMRDDSHLLHFYVSTRYQGRGIARRLWQRVVRDAVRRAGTCRFTLNATRCAVPVYVRLGFRTEGAERPSPNGVLTTPMSLRLPLRRSKQA